MYAWYTQIGRSLHQRNSVNHTAKNLPPFATKNPTLLFSYRNICLSGNANVDNGREFLLWFIVRKMEIGKQSTLILVDRMLH